MTDAYTLNVFYGLRTMPPVIQQNNQFTFPVSIDVDKVNHTCSIRVAGLESEDSQPLSFVGKYIQYSFDFVSNGYGL